MTMEPTVLSVGSVTEHVAVRGQLGIDELPMAPGFEVEAVQSVGNGLWREELEMGELTRHRRHAGGQQHQPREHTATRCGVVGRLELAGLLGQIQQDRVAVENRHVAVDQGGRLAVRVDRPLGRRVLFALVGVDQHDFVRQAALFEKQRHLGGIRGRMEIELDHDIPWKLSCCGNECISGPSITLDN